MKKSVKVTSLALAAAMTLSMTAMAADTFKIGGIGPISGPAAAYGSAVKNAMEIAAEEINAAGGINGYQVEISFQDDVHDASNASFAYDQLMDWGMQILEGTVTTKPCLEVKVKAADDNVFLLTPSASAPECLEFDNAFAVCFSDPAQGAMSARYIGEHQMAEKVAVIYNNSDPYSQGIYETFLQESENQPFEVVSAEAFTDGAVDFSVQLQKAQENGAELVFLPIYYEAASLILTQADQIGYEPTFFGVDGMDGILSLEGFDTSLAEGVILLTPFVADAEDELTVNFVTKYQEKYGEIPNQFGADAYDGLYIIKMAAEKAGITPDMSASDICEAMKTTMTEITFDGLTGTSTTWDAGGSPTKDPKAMVIQDGVYVGLD